MEIKTAEFVTSMAEYGNFPGKGLPQIAVVGRDYVNDGTIEIRDRNGDNKVVVPAAEAVETLLKRI